MLRWLAVLPFFFCAGCISFGRDENLTRMADKVWIEISSSYWVSVEAHYCFGFPAASFSEKDRKVTIFVPWLLNGRCARATMAYEMAKIDFVLIEDDSFWNLVSVPYRLLDSLLHGPVSETLSWIAIFEQLGKADPP
jgi:hypothetical protein